MSHSVVGLDVGNDTSCVAMARKRGIDVLLNKESTRETPSVVNFGDKMRFLGTDGLAKMGLAPQNTVHQLKRLLGRKFSDPSVQTDIAKLPFQVSEAPDGGCLITVQFQNEQQTFTPEQAMAMVLVDLKKIAENESGVPPVDCVLSVPVFYDEPQRYAMLNAAHIAGLNCLRLMNETTATALAYGIFKTDLPETEPVHVAFVDVGHSATQVSVVSLKKTGLHMRSHAWDESIGGREFDEMLFDHFNAEFKAKHKIDIRTNKKAAFKLRVQCGKAKKILSANTEASIAVECIMNDVDVRSSLAQDSTGERAKRLLAAANAYLKVKRGQPQPSMAAVAREHCVPYATLHRVIKRGGVIAKRGRPTALSAVEEEQLRDLVVRGQQLGVGVTKTALLAAVRTTQRVTERKGKVDPFKGKAPGKNWRQGEAEPCLPDCLAPQGSITRDEFEAMLEPSLQRFRGVLQQALQRSGVPQSEISSVEVVGSSTRIPCLARIVEEVFGKAASRTMNAKECVSRGCALQCAMLSPAFKVRDFEVMDTCPSSIEFHWEKDGEPTSQVWVVFVEQVLFEEGSAFPAAKMMTFIRAEPFNITAMNKRTGLKLAEYKVGPFTVPPGAERCTLKVKVGGKLPLLPLLVKHALSQSTLAGVPLVLLPLGAGGNASCSCVNATQCRPGPTQGTQGPLCFHSVLVGMRGIWGMPAAGDAELRAAAVNRSMADEGHKRSQPPQVTQGLASHAWNPVLTRVALRADMDDWAWLTQPCKPCWQDSPSNALAMLVHMNLHGIIGVDTVQAIEEEKAGEAAAKSTQEVKMEDAAASPATPEPSSNGDTPAPMESEPSSTGSPAAAPGATASSAGAKEKKKKVKKVDVAFQVLHVSGLKQNELDNLFEKECQMAATDKLMEDTADRKNAVESYLYKLRNGLHGSLGQYASPAEKDKVLEQLQACEDWLYDEGEDCSKSVYVAKLEELRALGDPITLRQTEEEVRPPAINNLRSLAEGYLAFAASTDPRYAHISSEERDTVAREAQAALAWLSDKVTLQSQSKKHDAPVLLSSDIAKKAETLERVARPITTKPAPKPAAPAPAPAQPSPTPEEPMDADGAPAAEGGAAKPEGAAEDVPMDNA
ncbi:hypothetical protein QJQ45_013439 [Haematococcus lacustris]|nr:hypothetical protein QJQ45_013439 [Haematococcus lacustris]